MDLYCSAIKKQKSKLNFTLSIYLLFSDRELLNSISHQHELLMWALLSEYTILDDELDLAVGKGVSATDFVIQLWTDVPAC